MVKKTIVFGMLCLTITSLCLAQENNDRDQLIELLVASYPQYQEAFCLFHHDNTEVSADSAFRLYLNKQIPEVYDEEHEQLALPEILIGVENYITNSMQQVFINCMQGLIKNFENYEKVIANPIIKYLFDHKDTTMKPALKEWIHLKSRNQNDQDLFVQAIKSNEIKMVQLLLEFGADVNALDGWERTPIFDACYTDMVNNTRDILDINIPKLLLVHGVSDINHRSKSGKTALLQSLMMGCNLEYAQLLIEQGINVNLEDEDGNSAWVMSMHANNTQLTRMLLDHGTDINYQNKNGNTALHIASMWGCMNNIDFLLVAGARTDIKNNDNQTAEDVAGLPYVKLPFERHKAGKKEKNVMRCTIN